MPQRPPIPCLRYDRADLAIDFLCYALGFARHAVFADDDDPTIIHHAQLSHGGGMIMVGSTGRGAADSLYGWQTPAKLGGITQCVCLVVDDVDSHHVHAAAAGAEIITRPHDNDGYPGRSYDARDPGGHVWNITSYDPWDA